MQRTLNVGEVKSRAVITAVKTAAPGADLVVVNAPPGVSCPVIRSIRRCDVVFLVTELEFCQNSALLVASVRPLTIFATVGMT